MAARVNFWLIILSLLLLCWYSLTSPLSILKNWEVRELLNAGGVFLLIFSGYFYLKRTKKTQVITYVLLFSLLITQFPVTTVLSFILIMILALVLGRGFLIEIMKIRSDFDLSIYLTAGYALLLGIVQVFVHFPVITQEVISIFFVIVLILFRKQLFTAFNSLICHLKQLNTIPVIPFTLLVGTAFCILIYVSFPETHSDALLANLRIAHQVLINGEWFFPVDEISWAAWPKGAAWLQAIHYIVGGEFSARLFNFFAIILTSLLVYKELVRLKIDYNGCLVLALFLSSPITFWCAFVLFDDAVFGLFVTASIISAVRLTENSSYLFLTMLFMSSAIATKITGVLLLPIVFFLFVLYFLRVRKINAKTILTSSIPLMLIGSIAYVYSYVKTGNPVLPLYNDIFKSEYFPIYRFADVRWSAEINPGFIYDLTSNTSKFMEGRNWTFGIHFAIFFIPSLGGMYLSRKNKVIILYFLSILLFSLLVFSQMRYARYLYPVFPIYMILISNIFSYFKSKYLSPFITFLCVISVFINFLNVKSLNMFYRFDLAPFWTGHEKRFIDYSEKKLNIIINAKNGKSSRVLYLHRPYSAGLDGDSLIYHWSAPLLKNSIDNVKSLEEVKNMLINYRITHILTDEEIMKTSPSEFSKYIGSISDMTNQIGTSQTWKVKKLND